MSESNGKVTAEIGGKTIELALPPSFAMRYEIVVAGVTNSQRAMLAALGACWAGKDRPRAKYAYDPLAYGGAVMDELHARGIPLSATWSAAGQAFALLSESVLTEREVAAAENFTEPPAAGSTA